MVDIHHHLLPGLDDGSTDLETSVAMARMAAEDGITHIVATPHANGSYAYDPVANQALLQTLREALASQGVPITLGLGCDFHMSYDNIQGARTDPHRYTINATDYLLIELPDFAIPPQMEESFYDLRVGGTHLILTHPERNPVLQKNPKRLAEWVQHGMLVQVTTSSVLGHMGPVAEKMAHNLLRERSVHFLATDAHNTGRRPPKMRAARDLVAQKYGADYADLICRENPLAVFEGRSLPAQPEAEHHYDYEEPKRSFFQRLFGR